MNIQDLISFSFIEGVGEKALKNLDSYSSYEDIAKLNDNELNEIFTNSISITRFRQNFSSYTKKASECLKKLKNSNSSIIKKNDNLYPQRLINANKSPVLLYCTGNTELLNYASTAAISGPRNASPDGLRKAYSTAKTLCAEDTVVISGLALGIDTEAHKAAAPYGKTIAVLPFFSPVYPTQNKPLYDNILLNGGLVIAEYFEMTNIKFNLLNRDKIIVELADELYIPHQFAHDSGTAYTIRYAQSQDKKIFYSPRKRFIKI